MPVNIPNVQDSGGNSRQRILMVQTRLTTTGGGAHLVACWMIQALVDEFDLTLATWEDLDFAKLNRHFGTSIDGDRLKICPVHPMLRHTTRFDPDPGSVQPNMLVMRMAKKMRGQFDLVMSAEMEYDFGPPTAGRPDIQYLHLPGYSHLSTEILSSSDLRGWPRLLAIVKGRLRPWMLIGDFSFERMRASLTLTNSHWTAQWIHTVYGIESTVLYPPAPGIFPQVPWEQRQNGVLCLGRLNPEKRADWIVEKLAPLRSKIDNLHLHIVGNQCYLKTEQEYYRRLSPLVAANKDWVTLHENISRQELTELASRQRYGIHARIDEHFGIAVAEMVRTGCIPLVHNSGGQVEIVRRDPRLIFHDDELGDKLLHLANTACEHNEVRSILAGQAELFTPERFMTETRNIVRRVLG